MKYDPEIYHRKSIRLRGYDYSQAGAYFVTICTKSKEYLFGDVVEGGMRLNEVGQMVQMIWDELPKYYQGVAINAFQIMPNHVHGIIILKHQIFSVGAGPRACPKKRSRPPCLFFYRATAGGCPYNIIVGCGASVQIINNHPLPSSR